MVIIVKKIELQKLESTIWSAFVSYTKYNDGEKYSENHTSLLLNATLYCSVMDLSTRIAEAIKKSNPDAAIVEITTYPIS